MTRTSISDAAGPYLDAVRTALENDEAFAQFRRLPGIKETVERVGAARGADYRETVLRQTPELVPHLEAFKANDAVGNPETHPFPEGMMSPTTWRYIKVLSDLRSLFGSLDGWHIAEIGAGYGGQCKIIGDCYQVGSYTVYDLEPVSRLARKYLVETGSAVVDKLHVADFERLGLDAPPSYDLVISNWALSECTKAMQDRYVEHVLRQSTCGYITYNQISALCGIDSYQAAELAASLPWQVVSAPERADVPAVEGLPFQNLLLHWDGRRR